MRRFLKKLFALIITLLIVSILAFLAFQIVPGDPTTKLLGTEATPQAIAQLRHTLGLDLPVWTRYGQWLAGFLSGDLGISYTYRIAVSDMLGEKLVISAALTLMAFAFTVILSIPLGIWAGSVKNKVLDWIVTAVNQITMSIPPFFLGIIACFLFGTSLRWFVPGEFVSYTQDPGAFWAYLILPALSIAIPRTAMAVKMLRGSILKELGQDYVRTARSRGNSRRGILWRHVLKNALIPVITFYAVSAAEIMTSSIIIEQVFTIPGIGRLLLASIVNRDFPVVQAIVVILAAWIVVVHFLADLLCQGIDPRVRLEGRKA